jgi:hypothetical protein
MHLTMHHLLATISGSERDTVAIVIFMGGGIVVALTAIITSAITKVSQTRHREESRREIAAYVAEGTISPDDAAKLLASGNSWRDKLAEKLRT